MAVASALSVIPTLVVPMPRPASLNAVFSAPVLVSMLLLAKRKCGLSAKAEVAIPTSSASARARIAAARRIILLSLVDSRSQSLGDPGGLSEQAGGARHHWRLRRRGVQRAGRTCRLGNAALSLGIVAFRANDDITSP